MKGLRDRTAIVGIGETEYVRKSNKNVKTLILEAVEKALADAGISSSQVDGIITEGVEAPRLFSHDDLAAHLGISRTYSGTISYGGAGNVGTALAGAMAIEIGLANIVLAYFGVNMGSATGEAYAWHELYPTKRSFEQPYGFWGQPTYFAMQARRYIHEYGLTSKQLGSIAGTQRRHAILNGRAQMQKPLTFEDYERSPLVADPLRVADCCLLTDGAAAFIMCSAERANDCPQPPVYVMGGGYAVPPISANSCFTQDPDYLRTQGAAEATRQALSMAGVSLGDVDFAEIYDCFTISMLIETEDIGFCSKGESGAFMEEGNNAIGGKLPINTHGGLLSHGYLIGFSHVIEAVRQLRHQAGAAQVKDAEIGLIGGLGNPEYSVLILRKR